MQTESESADWTAVPGYRPVSLLAIATAVAGVASALALVSPALWVVPLLTVALAAMALKDVAPRADSDEGGDDGRESASGSAAPGIDRKTGRWLALAGLALALGFGAQSAVSFVVGRTVMRSRAEASARMFLDMVRKERMADAIKCCLPQVTPPITGRNMDGPPTPDAQTRAAEAALRSMDVIRAIQRCGDDAPLEIHCVGPETRLKESWVLEVRVGPCPDGKPLKIKMLMQSRAVTRGKRPYDNWMVAGIAPDVGQ